MKNKSRLFLSIVMAIVITTAQADAKDDDDNNRTPIPCPEQAKQSMDAQFGHGTSVLTSCIQRRAEVKNIFAWNLATVNKRSGLAQQVQVTRNSTNNYESMYGMEINKDFRMVAIGYAAGGRWLITNEAYNRKFGVTTGNPTAALVQSLIERGVDVYMCQNTMRGNGWVMTDLLPGVKMVPSGALGILDFEHRGYKYINP